MDLLARTRQRREDGPRSCCVQRKPKAKFAAAEPNFFARNLQLDENMGTSYHSFGGIRGPRLEREPGARLILESDGLLGATATIRCTWKGDRVYKDAHLGGPCGNPG